MGTKFTEVYNCFLGKITDDMYMELTPADTVRDLQHLLTCAIPGFEFPRVQLNDYKIDVKRKWEHDLNPDDFVIGYIWNDLETDDITDQPESQMAIVDNSEFAATLSHEEMNILAILMMEGWLQRQITSIENTTSRHIVINAQSEKYEQLGIFKAILKTQGILAPDTVVSSSGTKSGNIVQIVIEGDLP